MLTTESLKAEPQFMSPINPFGLLGEVGFSSPSLDQRPVLLNAVLALNAGELDRL